jgi:hypothetical protein
MAVAPLKDIFEVLTGHQAFYLPNGLGLEAHKLLTTNGLDRHINEFGSHRPPFLEINSSANGKTLPIRGEGKRF